MRAFIDSFTQPTAADCQLDSSYTAGDPTLVVNALPTDVALKSVPFGIRIGSTIFDVTAKGGAGDRTWSVTRDTRTANNSYPAGANVFLNHLAADHEAMVQKALLTGKGSLFVATASGVVTELVVGTNGDFLRANSATATGLEWNPSGGNGLVLLDQATAAASAVLDLTGWYSSTYDQYIFELLNVVPATNNVDFYWRVSTDGGSTFDNSAVYANSILAFATAGTANTGNTTDTEFRARNSAEISNSASDGVCGTIHLFNPGSGSLNKRVNSELSYQSSALARIVSTGNWVTTTAIDAMRFFFSSGNIASGTIRVYGVSK